MRIYFTDYCVIPAILEDGNMTTLNFVPGDVVDTMEPQALAVDANCVNVRTATGITLENIPVAAIRVEALFDASGI